MGALPHKCYKTGKYAIMILKKEEVQKILDGQFVLDCPSLELSPSKIDAERQTYKGSGYLSFNENDYFEIKLYFPDSIPLQEVFESLNWKAGELIDKRFYYNLRATDIQGRNWEAKDILPDRSSGPGGTVIVGKAAQLVNSNKISSAPSKSYLKLSFNRDIRIPTNTLVSTETQVAGQLRNRSQDLKIARFTACDIDFEVEKDSGITILTATSDKVDFTENMLTNIIEAFHFVSGSIQSWSMLEIRDKSLEEVRLHATSKSTERTRIGPPISLNQSGDQIWKLFEKYLLFEMKNGNSKPCSLSSLVRSVISSGMSSLDVEALTLSVSIESLLAEEFGTDFETDENLENNISKVLELIKGISELDTNFRARLTSTISNMKRRRAKDFLIAFRNAGLIEPALVKAYGELRNKFAHGGRVNWAEIQNHIIQCSTILVLFYQLVFLRIGYTGIYTDYGSSGYPTREFSSTFASFNKKTLDPAIQQILFSFETLPDAAKYEVAREILRRAKEFDLPVGVDEELTPNEETHFQEPDKQKNA